MLEGAMHFDRHVEEAVGRPLDWPALLSTEFLYVALDGSLCTPAELAAFYESVQSRYDVLAAEGLTYVGTRPRSLWRPLSERAASAWLARVSDGRASPRPSSPSTLPGSAGCCARHSTSDVECRVGHHVESAEHRSGGYRVLRVAVRRQPWSLDARVVVNCLWEDRIRIDAQIGPAPARRWVHRLKYRLVGTTPAPLAGLPS